MNLPIGCSRKAKETKKKKKKKKIDDKIAGVLKKNYMDREGGKLWRGIPGLIVKDPFAYTVD